jgi:hypothetical protein
MLCLDDSSPEPAISVTDAPVKGILFQLVPANPTVRSAVKDTQQALQARISVPDHAFNAALGSGARRRSYLCLTALLS